MTFYLIGLGLNEAGFSWEAYQAIEACGLVYLENYTVKFPYKKEALEKDIAKKVKEIGRAEVESEEFLEEAKKKDICLLVYGAPLAATTHTHLIQTCREKKIKYKVVQGASIFDAAAETGLQMYKFGKTASMPAWNTDKNKSYKPGSFMEIVKQNQSTSAHTLILVDIGLPFEKAMEQLREAAENYKIEIENLVVCSQLGTKHGKIYFNQFPEPEEVKEPFCFIIPSTMHFTEKEFLEEM